MEHRRCCFAGHGQLSYGEDVYEKLIEVLKRLVTEENVTEFFVGNYGSFDRLCARAVRHIKEEFPHIILTLVVPYLTQEIKKNKDYFNSAFDSILVADMPENTPKAIQIFSRNSSYILLLKNNLHINYNTNSSQNQVFILNLLTKTNMCVKIAYKLR